MLRFPFHPKNYLELGIYSVLNLIVLILNPFAGFVLLHFVAFIFWSLRNNQRIFIGSHKNYLSPVDGTVVEIHKSDLRNGVEYVKLCIETSLIDSHAQISPISGNIINQEFVDSKSNLELSQIKFKSQFEFVFQNSLTTEISDTRHNLRCIVETVVKTVIPAVFPMLAKTENDTQFIDQGGSIATWHFNPFASMLTYIYLEAGTDLQVQIGQTVIAGQTVVGSKELSVRVFSHNHQ